MAPSPLRESELLAHIKTGLHDSTDTNLFIPTVHANRGTFTCPVYPEKATRPIAIFRMEAGRKLVRHESCILRLLQEKGSSALRNSIPKILWHGTWGDRYASLLTHLKGHQQTQARTNRGVETQLGKIAQWLAELYEIRPASAFPHSPKTFGLYQSQAKLTQHFGAGALVETIAEALSHLERSAQNQVLCHADLHPGNILVHQNRIHVLDWEYADWGLPVFDWFYYLCALFFEQSRKRPQQPDQWIQALQSVWGTSNKVGKLVQRRTAVFLETQGIEHRQLKYATKLGIFDFLRRRLRARDLEKLQPFLQRFPCE